MLFVDSDLAEVPPSWIHALVGRIHGGSDFCYPLRPPTWNGGDLTYHLAYPMMAGVFGADLREPLCGEIALSGDAAVQLAESSSARSAIVLVIDVRCACAPIRRRSLSALLTGRLSTQSLWCHSKTTTGPVALMRLRVDLASLPCAQRYRPGGIGDIVPEPRRRPSPRDRRDLRLVRDSYRAGIRYVQAPRPALGHGVNWTAASCGQCSRADGCANLPPTIGSLDHDRPTPREATAYQRLP